MDDAGLAPRHFRHKGSRRRPIGLLWKGTSYDPCRPPPPQVAPPWYQHFWTILQSCDPTTAPQRRVQEGKHQGLHCKVPLTIPQEKKKKKEKKGNQNRERGTRFGDVIQYSVGQHLSTSMQATHHPGSHQGFSFIPIPLPSCKKIKISPQKVKRNDTHFCSFFCSSFPPRVLFVFRAPLLDRAGQSENLRFA